MDVSGQLLAYVALPPQEKATGNHWGGPQSRSGRLTEESLFLPVNFRVKRRGISPIEFVSPVCVGRLRVFKSNLCDVGAVCFMLGKKLKVKVNFALQHAVKAKGRSRDVALLFL
jgi:hypothetical protein